ncbi:hypothetical protein BDN71DRAFT_1454674, partial [Pleurotus eryngii]
MRKRVTCLTPPSLHSRRMCTPCNIWVSPLFHIDIVSSALTKTHSSESSALAAVDTYTVALNVPQTLST